MDDLNLKVKKLITYLETSSFRASLDDLGIPKDEIEEGSSLFYDPETYKVYYKTVPSMHPSNESDFDFVFVNENSLKVIFNYFYNKSLSRAAEEIRKEELTKRRLEKIRIAENYLNSTVLEDWHYPKPEINQVLSKNLKDSYCVVEATTFEQNTLIKENSETLALVPNPIRGISVKHPNLDFIMSFNLVRAKYKGLKFLFIEPTSSLMDLQYIKELVAYHAKDITYIYAENFHKAKWLASDILDSNSKKFIVREDSDQAPF